mgnify:CR=1 FL=1
MSMLKQNLITYIVTYSDYKEEELEELSINELDEIISYL